MRKAILPKIPDKGTVTVHSIEVDCLVEYSDGSMNYERFYNLKFIDTPEDEQRAEFAKAAMQGYLSSGNNYKMAELVNLSILCADELIAELKRNK